MQNRAHQVRDVTLEILLGAGTLTVAAHKDYLKDANTTLFIGKSGIELSITPPMPEYSEFAVCLSPLTYDDTAIPLWRLLEWRIYLADIGIERRVCYKHYRLHLTYNTGSIGILGTLLLGTLWMLIKQEREVKIFSGETSSSKLLRKCFADLTIRLVPHLADQ